LYLKPQGICARTLPKSPENIALLNNKLLWVKKKYESLSKALFIPAEKDAQANWPTYGYRLLYPY
jgi:hypothetical protein